MQMLRFAQHDSAFFSHLLGGWTDPEPFSAGADRVRGICQSYLQRSMVGPPVSHVAYTSKSVFRSQFSIQLFRPIISRGALPNEHQFRGV